MIRKWLREGGRYMLRNGAIVTVTGSWAYAYVTSWQPKVEMILWQGHDEHGTRCSWNTDGSYGFSRAPHELDIVADYDG